MPTEGIEWYNCNLPRDQWTEDCPASLRDASAKDRGIIGSRNDDFKPMGWEEVKQLIATDRIDKFQRSPIELRRYREYIYQLERDHGSVMSFIINHRLRWRDLTPCGPPFTRPEDMKVLYNDWPYGIDTRIVHLVVWVKFDLEDDPTTGRLTAEARNHIQRFVDTTFRLRMDPNRVVWFKNWKSLKSVHAVEHFHVMLYDPDMAFVHAITNGDVPQSALARDSGSLTALLAGSNT